MAGSLNTDVRAWHAEVRALTELRHPCIVQYLGAVMEPPTHCLVLEYCDGGDVRTALRRPTEPDFALQVASSVAAGMWYLHRKGIMHRDLKSANVLLSHSSHERIAVKLTDFGIAVQVGHTVGDGDTAAATSLSSVGTFRWMAPEVARNERYSKSADVFSFAMLLFELITHQVPFADRAPMLAVLATSMQGQRPPIPDGTPELLRTLVHDCWQDSPAKRPTFEHVHGVLAQSRQSLSLPEQQWLDAPSGHPVYALPSVTDVAE